MPLAALLLLTCSAEPAPALLAFFAGDLQLTLAADENGPPPGSAYPPPPPLVQDPQRYPMAPAPEPAPSAPSPPPEQAAYPPPPLQPAHPTHYIPFSQPPTPPPVGDVGARFAWGIGLHVGLAEDQSMGAGDSSVSTNVGAGLGVYLRLGGQINDLWGVEAELSGATLLILDYVRSAVTVEITPVDGITLAFGPVAREDAVTLCGSTTTESLGATLRADFHIGTTRNANGRSAFTFGLAGDLGATVGGSDFEGPGVAWGLYVTAGYAHF